MPACGPGRMAPPSPRLARRQEVPAGPGLPALDRPDRAPQGAPVAIVYSLRHPGRIRRMVLLGGYARGWARRLTGEDLERREAMVVLARTGWGSDNPVYRQMFTSLFIPSGSPEQVDWYNEIQKITTSPRNAERLQRVVTCHAARAASLGHNSELSFCPLAVKGATPTVRSTGDGFAIDVSADGREEAAEILSRAQRLSAR